MSRAQRAATALNDLHATKEKQEPQKLFRIQKKIHKKIQPITMYYHRQTHNMHTQANND